MRILCTAKDSQIFSTKNNSVYVILMFEILTKRYLTTSLVLNNWAQVYVVVAISYPENLAESLRLHDLTTIQHLKLFSEI